MTDFKEIKEIKGNLFSILDQAPDNLALVHCVSRDLKMGAGIAVEFKNRFGSVDLLKSQNKTVGQCASLVRSSDNLLVSYLITKENYWGKPTYETLRSALKDFRQHALDHNVRVIAMPCLGCGLDRLNWAKVKPMIAEILEGFDVIVYYL